MSTAGSPITAARDMNFMMVMSSSGFIPATSAKTSAAAILPLTDRETELVFRAFKSKNVFRSALKVLKIFGFPFAVCAYAFKNKIVTADTGHDFVFLI